MTNTEISIIEDSELDAIIPTIVRSITAPHFNINLNPEASLYAEVSWGNMHFYINNEQYNRIIRAYSSTENESTSSSILTEEEQELLDQVLEEVHREIPLNSKSILINETTSRFSSAIWYSKIQEKNIILAGLGGIGSYVAFLLSRMRPSSIYMYDPDSVEAVNMSGQLYSLIDIGNTKVGAMHTMMANYSDYHHMFSIAEPFTENCEAGDIMICGFDNMAARELFFNSWLHHVSLKSEKEKENCLFIDGRLAAEEFQVLCIKGNDDYNIERYKTEFLFSDIQADETICSYKQTTFMANMIASIMVNLFTNFVANQCNPLIDRDLPFYTSYIAETMFFKTEL